MNYHMDVTSRAYRTTVTHLKLSMRNLSLPAGAP